MSQTPGATTRSMTPAGVAAIVVAAVALGFVLGAAVGWPPVGGSATPDDELALMCAAINQVDPSFTQRLEDGDVDFMGGGDDDATVHLLMASVNLAGAAARTGDADDGLRTAAEGLRESLEQLQGAAAGEHLDRLRQYC